MTILVTGASGFVGRELVRALAARDYRLRCLNGSTTPAPVHSKTEWVAGNLNDLASIERALSGVECIVHLASTPNGLAPLDLTRVNYGGTVNLIQVARNQGVKRIVLLSVLGANPTKATPLAYSKWLAEETVKRSGLGFTVLRSSVIVGAEDRFLSLLVRRLRRALPLLLPGFGRIKLQPVWVGDVVRCLIACVEDPHAAGRTYAVGGPEILSYRELLRRLAQRCGGRRLIVPAPPRLFQALIRRYRSHAFTMVAELSLSGRDSVTEPAAIEKNFRFEARRFEEVLPPRATPWTIVAQPQLF
ncbi:MAG TPA: NAD-dependent epimerase/dehydratase family protein [Methylomirabilota bacterium]|nr:NAD-dependent epimerase/dehydratase family protein [Methylomirabilota bacterium]